MLFRSDGVVDAFEAVATAADGTRDIMGSYLLHGVNVGEDVEASGGADGWNLDDLITYKNWTKN